MMTNPHLPETAKTHLGPAAYIALRQYRGSDLPKWDELTDELRAEWCTMVEGEVESFMAKLEAHQKNVDISDTPAPQHKDIQNF